MEGTENKGEIKFYELGYLLVPNIPDEKLPEAVGKVIGAIEQAGGVIVSSDAATSRELAYTLSRRSQGKRTDYSRASFGWARFEVEPISIQKIKEMLDANPEVLRSLITEAMRVMTIPKGRTFKPKQPGSPEEIPANPLSEAQMDQEIETLIASTEK